jgi:hypothetical protein
MPDPNDTTRPSVRTLSRPFRGPGARGDNAMPEPRGAGRPNAPFAAPRSGGPVSPPGSPLQTSPQETDLPTPSAQDLPSIESFSGAEPAAANAVDAREVSRQPAPLDEVLGTSDPADGGSSGLPLLYMPTPAAAPIAVADETPVHAAEAASGVIQADTELEPNATSEYETSASDETPPVVDDPRAGRRYSPSAASWPEDVWSDAPLQAVGRGGETRSGEPTPAVATSKDTSSAPQAHPLADALEGLARRIRSGELPVAGYQAGMGDAAALTAVLSAVMGLRK